MQADYKSPLLDLPNAVSGDGIDAPVAAHYGSFVGEQRTLEANDGFVDLSHRDVIRISGPATRAALVALSGKVPSPRTAVLRELRDPDTQEVIDRGFPTADQPATQWKSATSSRRSGMR